MIELFAPWLHLVGRLEPQAIAGGEVRARSSVFEDHEPTNQPTKYYSVLQSTKSTTPYYKVLLLRTTQYYKVPPITTQYRKIPRRTTPYDKLLQRQQHRRL